MSGLTRRSGEPELRASTRRACYADFGLFKPFGALAQLGERRLCKPEVAGSIPARSTFRKPC
jgi:hypothetical protein